MKGAIFMRDIADTYNNKTDRLLDEMGNFILMEAQKGKYSAKMPYPQKDFTDEVISALHRSGYCVTIPKDKSGYVIVSWK